MKRRRSVWIYVLVVLMTLTSMACAAMAVVESSRSAYYKRLLIEYGYEVD